MDYSPCDKNTTIFTYYFYSELDQLLVIVYAYKVSILQHVEIAKWVMLNKIKIYQRIYNDSTKCFVYRI